MKERLPKRDDKAKERIRWCLAIVCCVVVNLTVEVHPFCKVSIALCTMSSISLLISAKVPSHNRPFSLFNDKNCQLRYLEALRFQLKVDYDSNQSVGCALKVTKTAWAILISHQICSSLCSSFGDSRKTYQGSDRFEGMNVIPTTSWYPSRNILSWRSSRVEHIIGEDRLM